MTSPVLRLLDAALNRAREAARSAEDYARFVAPDAIAARGLKALRQALGRAGRGIPSSARDVGSDALKDHTLPSERLRRDPEDVARASLKRLQEALRSVEEFGKLLNGPLSGEAKRLRFEAYRIESALFTPPALKALREARLYAVLSPELMPGDPFRGAKRALEGGVQVLQLRCKGPGWSDRAILALTGRILPLCRRHEVPFFLNDRLDLALASGADGVHLGQSDMSVSQARTLAGRRLMIGISTHTERQIRQACRTEIDYLAVGPVFPTLTKPNRGAVGLALLKRVPAGAPPVFAIGGITQANLPQVLKAGASRVAVTGAAFRATDVRASSRTLRRALDKSSRRAIGWRRG